MHRGTLEPTASGDVRHETLIPQDTEDSGPSLEAPPPRACPDVEPGMLSLEELADDDA